MFFGIEAKIDCERKWVRFVSIFIDPIYFVLANKKEAET